MEHPGDGTPILIMFLQKVQYNQKVQECQSLRTELSRFVSTPTISTASSAAHTGLSSSSRSSASPPSSRVASPTSIPSYISNISSPLSRLGLTRSASVAPTPTRSASTAPTSPSRSSSNVPPRISTPGVSSTHRSATPSVPSYRSTTPASPSPIRKSRTMSMSQQQPPPLPPWPANLAATAKSPALTSSARPQGPRVPTRV